MLLGQYHLRALLIQVPVLEIKTAIKPSQKTSEMLAYPVYSVTRHLPMEYRSIELPALRALSAIVVCCQIAVIIQLIHRELIIFRASQAIGNMWCSHKII